MGELSKRAFLVGASGSAIAAMMPVGEVAVRKFVGSYRGVPVYEVGAIPKDRLLATINLINGRRITYGRV